MTDIDTVFVVEPTAPAAPAETAITIEPTEAGVAPASASAAAPVTLSLDDIDQNTDPRLLQSGTVV
jgi:hypothetical protein